MQQIPGLPDRFTLKKELGSGGMAIVYLASDSERGCDIALKKLQSRGASNFRNAFTRFKREYTLLSTLTHPNLIETYELHETAEGEPFLTMEYLDGVLLSDLIKQNSLSFEEKLSITLQLAKVLAYLHSNDVIHRDIKPSNVIIQSGLQVKLLDFGLSRYIEQENQLTLSTELIGSPAYVSPELVNNKFQKDPADHRADIYSFGITIFELFTGKPPFNYPLSWNVLAAHLKEDPPKLREFDKKIPTWLEQMVNICLQKKQEHRYGSMQEIVELIEDKQGGFSLLPNTLTLKDYQKTHLRNSLRGVKGRYGIAAARLFFSFFVAFGAAFVWLTLPLGVVLDQALLRQIFTLRGPIDPPEDIVIVAIDDTTFQKLELSPRQPLPRKYFADALEQIISANPRLVILDLAAFRETDDEEANSRIERALGGSIPVTIILKH